MTPSAPRRDERGHPKHRRESRHQILGRRQARRLSRQFACVGVTTTPERLQAMMAGAPVAASEVTDFNFALIASQLERDERNAKFKRLQRRGTRSLIFVGLLLVTLHFLVCFAYALFSLIELGAPV
jgi:hypothetical protein